MRSPNFVTAGFVSFLVALAALGPSACGSHESSAAAGAGGSSGSSGTGSSGAGAGPAACQSGLSAGFAPAPSAYTLPAPRCNTAFDSPGSNNAALTFGLLDLTGDKTSDLVVTNDTCSTDVGTTHWDVYAGGATGFAATPTPYTLPAPRCQTDFNAAAKTAGISYSLLSLSSGPVASLVVTKDACDKTVGNTHWDVYSAGSTGFAAAPTPYTVPAPRCSTQFDAAGSSGFGGLKYSMLDLTGDGQPDLVVQADPCDTTVGSTHWDVYAGGATGFAPAPVPFSIPAPRCQTKFDAAAGTGAVSYSLQSLGGSGSPDLVVTNDTCDASVGATHWDRYAWSAQGFAAAPTPYTIPAARCQTRFDAASGSGAVLYGLGDLSCDGLGDLVVTSDSCDNTVGATHWDVYLGGASGFAAAPSPLGIPAARCQTKFDRLSGASAVGFGLMNLVPGKPQLVVYKDGCDSTVGQSHWDVYPMP